MLTKCLHTSNSLSAPRAFGFTTNLPPVSTVPQGPPEWPPSDAGLSISGIPPKLNYQASSREAKHSTQICRNSRGVVPVGVGQPVVQVRNPETIMRPVVEVADAKNPDAAVL